MTKENIGFVGLGRMGMRMALRLVDSFSVFGTDKDPSLKNSSETNGVTWADDSWSLAAICRHIFIVAGSESDVTEIIFGERGLHRWDRFRNYNHRLCDRSTKLHAGIGGTAVPK